MRFGTCVGKEREWTTIMALFSICVCMKGYIVGSGSRVEVIKIKLADAWAEGLSDQRQHRSGANYIFGIGFILAAFDVGKSCIRIM